MKAPKTKENNSCARHFPPREIELNTSSKSNLSLSQLIAVHYASLKFAAPLAGGNENDDVLCTMLILIINERPSIRVLGTTI